MLARLRLARSAQGSQDHAAVHQGFQIARVEPQGGIDSAQRFLRLPHQIVRQREQMMGVGVRLPRPHQLLQQMDAPVVVLECEPVLRLVKQL